MLIINLIFKNVFWKCWKGQRLILAQKELVDYLVSMGVKKKNNNLWSKTSRLLEQSAVKCTSRVLSMRRKKDAECEVEGRFACSQRQDCLESPEDVHI